MKNATLAMILSIQRLFGNFGDTDETLRTRFQTEIGGNDPNRKKRKRKVRVWGRSPFAFRKNPIGKMRRNRSLDQTLPLIGPKSVPIIEFKNSSTVTGNEVYTAVDQTMAIASKPPFGVSLRVPAAVTRTEHGSIYFHQNFHKPEFREAQKLLRGSAELLQEAHNYSLDGRTAKADELVTKFGQQLPELFALREVGEGFATVVSALKNAIQNQDGTPMKSEQILSVLKAIEVLKLQPAITFDASLDVLSSLMKSGLEPKSKAVQAVLSLVELLDDLPRYSEV